MVAGNSSSRESRYSITIYAMRTRGRGEGGREGSSALDMVPTSSEIWEWWHLGAPSHSSSHTFPRVLVPRFPGTYGLGDFVWFYFSRHVLSLACPVPKASQSPSPLPVKTAVPAGPPPRAAKGIMSYTNFTCMNN